ncbi:MAG: hypothetical protein QM754_08535 [Tepidisphaeraceae bacterium]
MGLYDDDNAAITSGDLADVIYWQTKFEFLKLEAALAGRQPEYAINGILPGIINGAADVLKTYPNHAEVKAWSDKARLIQTKIDPNAAPADFRTDFAHWKDHSYEAGWRHLNVAKSHAARNDQAIARSHARDAVTQLTRAKDRCAAWPADVQAWVNAALAESQAIVG